MQVYSALEETHNIYIYTCLIYLFTLYIYQLHNDNDNKDSKIKSNTFKKTTSTPALSWELCITCNYIIIILIYIYIIFFHFVSSSLFLGISRNLWASLEDLWRISGDLWRSLFLSPMKKEKNKGQSLPLHILKEELLKFVKQFF